MSYGNCQKCGSEMEQGLLLEHGDSKFQFQAHWIEGQVEKNWWGG